MRQLWSHYSLRLLLFATILYGVIFSVNGLVIGGDSNWYLKLAQGVTQGNFDKFGEFPFHYLYAVLLSPGYLLIPDHAVAFATVTNALILIALPLLFYRISLLLTKEPRLSYLAGVAVMFQVEFIFWALFVLTDVLFLTLLAAFILCIVRATNKQEGRQWIVLAIVSALLLFARPTSLIALPIGWFYVLYRRPDWAPLIHPRVAVMVAVVGGVAAIHLATAAFSLPTVYQSLWLSTRTSTNNIDEITEGFKFDLPAGMTEKDYKLQQFEEFVTKYPVKYVAMCAQRFVAFWHPWVWGAWSLPHKVIEVVYSALLTMIALYAVFSRRVRGEKWLLLSLALGFSLLTTFGQIDSDIRYRLPSELCILLLAPTIMTSWIGKMGWRGRPATTFH